MSRCPDPGALRAALDGERSDLAAHLVACPSCRAGSRAQAEDARVAAEALDTLPSPVEVDVDAALAQLRHQAPAEVVSLGRAGGWRGASLGQAAAALVILVVVAGLVVTPGGRAAASSLLERFRSEQVAVVPVDLAAFDPAALEALVEVADIEGLEQLAHPQPVADLREAAEISGIEAAPLNTAALPPDVTGRVIVRAQAPQTVRVDLADHPDLPAEVRGAVLVVHVPGAVVQTVGWVRGVPAVVRGEAGMLEVAVEGGPSLGQVRDALLSLPGLPPEAVAALRGIEEWETTLPLPVPLGHVVWQETTVHGRPALAFGDETGVAAALLWRDGGHFVGVGGMLPLSEARRLAEEG